ncbi:hypothetical protein EDB83DRAFT_2314659 [Lactarius deliciosus]|nr:hypothetical protein EDB83DRAFT_2314659 [Lactarius deliciosus]
MWLRQYESRQFQAQPECWRYTSWGVKILTVPGQATSKEKIKFQHQKRRKCAAEVLDLVQLALMGGRDLRIIGEYQNKGHNGNETDHKDCKCGVRTKDDKAKAGVTLRVEEIELDVVSSGSRCGGVEWHEVGMVTEASCCMGRRGIVSLSDNNDDLNDCRELQGIVPTADKGVWEDSSSRLPSTRDRDANAGGKLLDEGGWGVRQKKAQARGCNTTLWVMSAGMVVNEQALRSDSQMAMVSWVMTETLEPQSELEMWTVV